MGKKPQEQTYETTTRSGAKVRVEHGLNGKGEKVSLVADGRGYKVLNVDPPHSKK